MACEDLAALIGKDVGLQRLKKTSMLLHPLFKCLLNGPSGPFNRTAAQGQLPRSPGLTGHVLQSRAWRARAGINEHIKGRGYCVLAGRVAVPGATLSITSMERIEDLTYKAQQRQRQGRTSDAIRLFEQALEFRIDLHGAESSSVRKACDNLSDVLNGAALKHLQVEEYEEAKKLLQKAEMLTGPDDLISAVTYNNIACYYRRYVLLSSPVVRMLAFRYSVVSSLLGLTLTEWHLSIVASKQQKQAADCTQIPTEGAAN